MKSISACPICKSTSLSPFINCADHTVSHETFNLITCQKCSLTITSPRPDDIRLGDYYLSENYISHTSTATNLIDKIYLVARSLTLRWKVKTINSFITQKPASLLDFGCGSGEFLQFCKTKGFHVTGVEPSALARARAEKLTSTPILENLSQIHDEKFDVITLWHVLEHIPDLNSILDLLQKKLKTNGTLFIAVPNHTSADSLYYQQFWAAYDVPRHLWHFTPQSMQKLLSNHSLSLVKTVPMKLDAYYISLLSEKYKSNNKTTFAGILRAFIQASKSNMRAHKTNQYSSLLYISKKCN